MQLYEGAIRAARQNGFVQNEGIGSELAARFYLERGYQMIGLTYLREARYCFLRWGALGKVKQLDEHYPGLADQASIRPAATIGTPVEQLDVETVIKASHAVSGEIVLEKLIQTLMLIAVEHAGAERGLLILPHVEEHRIEAEIRPGADEVRVQLRKAPVTSSELPESLFRYVIRTQEKVILDDASAQNLFSEDEYVRGKRPRSVLCLPLIRQTRLIGVLYLENNLAPGVFTPERLAMLDLLASQAAISLDHARVYAELAQENSERKRAEEELRRSEAFLAQGQRISHTGSWRWLVATGTVHWSEETFRIFGANPKTEKPAYSLFMERVHPEDRTRVEAILNRAAQDKSDFEFDYRIVLPEGSIKLLRSVGQPMVSPSGELEFIGTVMDITEGKRAEEQQRYHMELLKTVTDNASSMLYIVDAAGLGTFVNPAFQRITGYRAEEVIGQILHDKIHHTKPDGTPYPVHECPLAGAARTGKIVQGEDLFVRKDGTFFPVRYTASPIFREGVVVGTVIEVQDLTDHKRAEEAWREAQVQLAHVTRVATLGELAGSIAHEVNQPLTAIINNADACLALLPGEISKLDDVREALSDIISDADRASAVLARIRGLIKKSPLQKSRLDLNETIGGVIALARGVLDRNEVLLRIKLANDLPLIMGDRIHLQQVILNLVINGIEAMSGVSDGPRELWVSSEKLAAMSGESEHRTPIRRYADTPTRPDAGHEGPGSSLAEAEATYVLVSVADSGPGLDLNNIDRLFDAFYTTKPQGLGMGLSISRSIIEAHGGRLWARANVPKGALFQFTLPIAND